MHQPPQERRTIRRFDMRLPAAVKIVETVRRSFLPRPRMSAPAEVYFYLDRPLEPGARIDVTLTFPPHVTLTDSVRVRFAARVIRVESLPASRNGVAATIEEYEFLRSQPGPDFLNSAEIDCGNTPHLNDEVIPSPIGRGIWRALSETSSDTRQIPPPSLRSESG